MWITFYFWLLGCYTISHMNWLYHWNNKEKCFAINFESNRIELVNVLSTICNSKRNETKVCPWNCLWQWNLQCQCYKSLWISTNCIHTRNVNAIHTQHIHTFGNRGASYSFGFVIYNFIIRGGTRLKHRFGMTRQTKKKRRKFHSSRRTIDLRLIIDDSCFDGQKPKIWLTSIGGRAIEPGGCAPSVHVGHTLSILTSSRSSP